MSIPTQSLRALKRSAATIEQFASGALGRDERRTLAKHQLFDARKWHGGYSGPPFGFFNEARMRWWRALLAEVKDQRVEGVVLSPRQLDDMVYLAGRPSRRGL